MESNDASSQLADVERLKTRTVRESSKSRASAMPSLAVATVLFFSSYEIESQWVELVAPVVWTIFIVIWVRWVRSDNRALPRWTAMSRTARGHVIVGWIVGLAAAGLAAFVGTRVSWVLAGVLMAAVVAAGGTVLQRAWAK